MRRRPLSDRRKVFAAVLALTVVAFAAFGYLTVRATENRLVERLDEQLEREVRSAEVVTAVLTPEQLAPLNEAAQVGGRQTAYLVLDPTGRVVRQLPSGAADNADPVPVLPDTFDAAAVSGESFDLASADGSFRYRARVGELPGDFRVVMAMPLTGVEQTIDDLVGTMLLIAVVAIAIVALVLWTVLSAARRPIDEMIDVAARIGDGDLGARVDPAALHGDAGRLAFALNQMVTRIESAFAQSAESETRLRRFVADASHELRTPLTSIRGYAELVRAGGAAADTDAAVRRIEAEAKRMGALIDDLLLLARLDQGRALDAEPVDLAALVREIAGDAQVVEPWRPIDVDVPDTAVVVLGDDRSLRQVLSNLLGNVRVHTDPHTPVAVAVDASDADVVVTVRDAGPGMSADAAARAFDRFYRPDDSRSRDSGGSGLGLSIAKAVVEAHGGTIALASRPGAGTTVRFTLPRVATPAVPV